jgi:hypothetical protein
MAVKNLFEIKNKNKFIVMDSRAKDRYLSCPARKRCI